MTRFLATLVLLLATACGTVPAFASGLPQVPEKEEEKLVCDLVGFDLVNGLAILHCTVSIDAWNELSAEPEPEDEGIPI